MPQFLPVSGALPVGRTRTLIGCLVPVQWTRPNGGDDSHQPTGGAVKSTRPKRPEDSFGRVWRLWSAVCVDTVSLDSMGMDSNGFELVHMDILAQWTQRVWTVFSWVQKVLAVFSKGSKGTTECL